ncbi:bacteriohopanetetrol glucosamine biosynthesis glycosyltransferase HpnI [Burkholderia glumae]|uniref:Bacteriohopanetetrol glucosamine biosynthesis glycosyltransferase HpnI n=1 Tax=Burkholderia glumae TaxID=337 RepID=A0AAP9XXV3_BURGL|nr:bacteriohopanetetrol glucosamine biosynthesis glycosyltransferase HpnI [Burkholderia glumae]ACR30826.1 hopanoid biosynthesis associated glycosyl transferase protein HpnI [Burkholderia glumae BGR1]KHJ61598.1 glucosyltransferase [Burkholderia glumae]MCM2483863.1 bacteriohopanetetrol glucosamine biosynthesis glycosyltransferase HpnI [Burkholderia glumae]MCM2494210.1 bacteriohopanetetrol glucosamine biosynthesis glycosyltransferase HpnI [Burkholderia glumae]MCM2509557.1 bacteriohopanetetrol glu
MQGLRSWTRGQAGRAFSMSLAVGAAIVLSDAARHHPPVIVALGHALATAASLCAGFGIVYTLIAAVLTGRFFARAPALPTQYPPVTLMKPLHGDEWQLVEHLASFFDQDYPGPVQYLFGVHDANDAALRAVATLRERYPQAHVTVVADARLYGPNRKICNLVNMLEQAEHALLCFADSDVRVGRDYLRRVVGALEQPGVGLVTSAYRGISAPGRWPRAAAAATNYQFFPGVVTGLATRLARPCFGQTIAMRRATLEAIGGLAAFAHHLAEDHAIGEAVRGIGATVAVPPLLVDHACIESTFRALFAHELRWSRTIRAADPLGHLGSALMHPLPFALLALLASGGALGAGWLVAAALAARFALKWRVDRAFGQPFADLALLPLNDLLQFGIFVASFAMSDVVWRGRRLRVDPSGRLVPRLDE